jgi:hypothetical protein
MERQSREKVRIFMELFNEVLLGDERRRIFYIKIILFYSVENPFKDEEKHLVLRVNTQRMELIVSGRGEVVVFLKEVRIKGRWNEIVFFVKGFRMVGFVFLSLFGRRILTFGENIKIILF